MTASNAMLAGSKENTGVVNQNQSEYLSQWQAAVSALYKTQPNAFFPTMTNPAALTAAQNIWVANSQAQLAAFANDPTVLQHMQGQNLQNAFNSYNAQLQNMSVQQSGKISEGPKVDTEVEKGKIENRGTIFERLFLIFIMTRESNNPVY